MLEIRLLLRKKRTQASIPKSSKSRLKLDARIKSVIEQVARKRVNSRYSIDSVEDIRQDLWVKYLQIKSMYRDKPIEDRFKLLCKALWNYATDKYRQNKRQSKIGAVFRFSEIAPEYDNWVDSFKSKPAGVDDKYVQAVVKNMKFILTQEEYELLEKLSGQDEQFTVTLANLVAESRYGLTRGQIQAFLSYACRQPLVAVPSNLVSLQEKMEQRLLNV